MQCGIIEVASVEDTVGYPCSRDAVAKCSDCGIPACDAHAEDCELCNQAFCATCLAFHNRIENAFSRFEAYNATKEAELAKETVQ